MSDDTPMICRRDLVEALIEASEAGDTERMDQILDLLRLEADYEAMVEDLALCGTAEDAESEEASDLLRSLPSFSAFAALRGTTN